MRPIIKIFFFSWMGLILFFTPLLAEQQGSESNSEAFKGTQVIMDDFLVNDDTIGGCKQDRPAIAQASFDYFVITWIDSRSGYYDIYAQRYSSSGTPLGYNIKVNDYSYVLAGSPTIAMDSAANFVITWQDFRNGNSDIYAQRFDSSGTPLGINFKVNEDVISAGHESPYIAMEGNGNFIISWTDERNGSSNYDIYAQIYSFSGTPLGSNFKVNDDVGSATQAYPSIALDGSGNFVITWTDYRNAIYNPDIYTQRYNAAGLPLGSNFKVSDDTGTAEQMYPDIAMDDSGNFVITWHDERNRNYDVYAQRYNTSGISLGSNFRVNDGTGTALQWHPGVAMDSSGKFVITWEDWRYGFDIYAQRYSPSGVPLDTNFKVNDSAQSSGSIYPDIAMDDSGNFVITWIDYRYGSYDPNIYVQRYNYYGSSLGANYRVNDDYGSTEQRSPSLAVDSSGNFVITWEDERNGWYSSNIYAQRYNPSGTPSGFNFKAGDDTLFADQRDPAIAMDGYGNFVIAWRDYRQWWTDFSDIYAQKFDTTGIPLGSNFKVNDDTGSNYQHYPAIGMDGSGNFVITWVDYRSIHGDIYAQRYDFLNNSLDSNFKVNDDAGIAYQLSPAIAIDRSGNFVIAWHDPRNFNGDIYAQRYDSAGIPLDSNFKVNYDTGTTNQYAPAIAMDCSGDFVITWYDEHSGNFDIYAQRYDSSGIPLGFNFKVNDDVGTASQSSPVIAMDGYGNFVIAWKDYRNGNPDIYAQRYNSLDNPIGNNYLVPNPQFVSFAQSDPSVAANDSKIYFAWQDNRRAKGWDIYAKVVDWNWTKVGEEEVVGLPNTFELAQNYPNPFNPTTTIPFTVSGSQFMVHSPIHTTLVIYNILGQKVRTLVDEEKLPGNYSIIWDGKDYSGKEVASGIYFYQLKTKDFSDTQKMVLLR
jgi:hypothetical protein